MVLPWIKFTHFVGDAIRFGEFSLDTKITVFAGSRSLKTQKIVHDVAFFKLLWSKKTFTFDLEEFEEFYQGKLVLWRNSDDLLDNFWAIIYIVQLSRFLRCSLRSSEILEWMWVLAGNWDLRVWTLLTFLYISRNSLYLLSLTTFMWSVII